MKYTVSLDYENFIFGIVYSDWSFDYTLMTHSVDEGSLDSDCIEDHLLAIF